MKHRKLSVSLTLLIGAVCLSGDSWKKCTNNCETQYQKDLSNDLAVYNTSVQQAAGHYAQCTNPLCLNGGTTFGCCTQSALNNDCYPLNSDGSCKNQAAYDSDYSACKTQFCGTGNCPADPLLCQQGNGGTCCSVYGTETNLAQAAKDSADHQANQQYGQNVAGCQTGCGCSTGDDCSQANQDSQCDTGTPAWAACAGAVRLAPMSARTVRRVRRNAWTTPTNSAQATPAPAAPATAFGNAKTPTGDGCTSAPLHKGGAPSSLT